MLENHEDSQIVDSGSMEQDVDATSTGVPMVENQEDSQVADLQVWSKIWTLHQQKIRC